MMVSSSMQILVKIGLNPAELWPKPFLLGQLLFDFPYPLGQLLAGPSIRKPRYVVYFSNVSISCVFYLLGCVGPFRHICLGMWTDLVINIECWRSTSPQGFILSLNGAILNPNRLRQRRSGHLGIFELVVLFYCSLYLLTYVKYF